jgi:cytohesin
VNKVDNIGRTPLCGCVANFYGAEGGHNAVVRALIEAGADVNKANKGGFTPMQYAADFQKESEAVDKVEAIKAIAQLLRDAGAKDISCEDELRSAASDGDVARVRTLIEAGADVNHTDAKGYTVLTEAAAGDEADSSEAIVRALIEAGADVNKAEEDAWPPLLVAATHGHEAVVRALIDAGADVNKKVKYGYTPLSRATDNGNEAVAQLLRDAGAA